MCTNTPSVPPSREEEAIKLDGLSVAEMRGLRDKAEKHVFQAEVNRMMKLIINSLYRNKEVGEGGVASAVVHARLHIIAVVKLMFLRVRNCQISCGTDGQFCPLPPPHTLSVLFIPPFFLHQGCIEGG